MNYENVTLCKLALASTMYDSLTPFNYSLGRLNEATGGSIDLTNPAHRISLMKWLNDWGCRHLSENQHDVASNSIIRALFLVWNKLSFSVKVESLELISTPLINQ